MLRRETNSVRAAHRVPDHERAVDRECIEDRDRVGNELRCRVCIRGLPAVAVTARVRRDQPESSRDRIGEEVPVAAVVTDAVQQQCERSVAAPIPRAKRDIGTVEGVCCRT